MHVKHKVISAVVALTVAPLLAGSSPPPDSVSRSCGMVLDQTVCTWIVMDGANPVELGATVPLALVEAVPADAEMTWPPQELASIALPDEARASLGIDHLGINWEAHGHPPGPFLTPHFDFHFYTLTQQGVREIDCTDGTKPATVPSDYALPDLEVEGLGTLVGLCVPSMGMHAMPREDLERTDPFDATMVVGYYGGEAVFLEPMVSRHRLLERSDFTLSVPAIESLPPEVRYPTEFRAEYDTSKDEYRFVMTGFQAQ